VGGHHPGIVGEPQVTGRVRPRSPVPARSLRVLLAVVALLLLAVSAGGSRSPALTGAVLTRTPPMGIDNWNATGCSAAFTEAYVHAEAEALLRTGLAAAGYRYVNLDDCWAAPQRDPAGRLVADPVRFPSGIAALADYVHQRGLLLGIYTSAGTRTCASPGFPGALGHEQQDAATFAAWRVDYLKYDNCNPDGVDARTRYTAMAQALRSTGRPIVYAICDWGDSRPWQWAPGTAALWRITDDVTDTWGGVAPILRTAVVLAGAAAGPGWNDPDLLETGNPGLRPDEQRTQFGVWAMLSAPLLISTDLAAATPDTLALLANRDVIALDQDPLAAPARLLRDDGAVLVLRRALADGGAALAVVNLGDQQAHVTGLPATTARDLWTGRDVDGRSVTLAPHATALLRLPPGS
jgi:alpha-galactosidase